MTIVVVSHEIESIKRIADRITYLEKGKVIFSGLINEALEKEIPSIKNFFLT